MFLKRLVYWVGFLFILGGIFVAGILFMQSYPDLHFRFVEMTGIELPEIVIVQPAGVQAFGFGIVAACGVCALGSYLVMAMELRRLRKKTEKRD